MIKNANFLFQKGAIRRVTRTRIGQLDVNVGDPRKIVPNQAKIVFPVRASTKLDIARIVSDLEVDDEHNQPFKSMRYPLAPGPKYKQLLAERTAWFMANCNLPEDRAESLAKTEFTAFYGTQNHLVNLDDPGQIVQKLTDMDAEFDANLVKEHTKRFFALAQKDLILMTPMKTYQKQRYYPGLNIDLLKDNEWPEPVGMWTANGFNLTNIISQVNLKGIFTPEEEEKIIQEEKSYVMVATEFGSAANEVRIQHQNDHLDFLHQKITEGFSPRFIHGNVPQHPIFRRGAATASIISDDNRSEVASVIDTDNETIIGSEYNQPRMSLDPAKALPPPTVSVLLCQFK